MQQSAIEAQYWHKLLPKEATLGPRINGLTIGILGKIRFLVDDKNFVQFVYKDSEPTFPPEARKE